MSNNLINSYTLIYLNLNILSKFSGSIDILKLCEKSLLLYIIFWSKSNELTYLGLEIITLSFDSYPPKPSLSCSKIL